MLAAVALFPFGVAFSKSKVDRSMEQRVAATRAKADAYADLPTWRKVARLVLTIVLSIVLGLVAMSLVSNTLSG